MGDRCEVHVSCQRPPAVNVDGVAHCERHWQLRCDARDEAWRERRRAAHADDPVALDHLLTCLLGDHR